jgi:hypothetical protein
MTTIAQLSHDLQSLFTHKADEEAKRSGFIIRRRAVTGSGFAQGIVLGWAHQPQATRKQLHASVLEAGLTLTPQALDQRFTAAATTFMRGLLEQALQLVVSSPCQRALLTHFNGVYVTDSSQVRWGAEHVKLGVRLDLQRGGLEISLEPSTRHDQKIGVLDTPLPSGALALGDLGFFKLDRFEQWNEQGVGWVTRLKVGTRLTQEDGRTVPLEALLEAHVPFSIPVKVGRKQTLAAYLVAAPLGDNELKKRQAHLKETVRKKQRPLSEKQLTVSHWTLYLTNLPGLSFEQAHILARTRWQIEMLFKLWKSHSHVADSRSKNPHRRACEGYAKLLAVVVKHWLLLVGGWDCLALSSVDALHLIQKYVPHVLQNLAQEQALRAVIERLKVMLHRLPRHSRRKANPLAFQLWELFDASFP